MTHGCICHTSPHIIHTLNPQDVPPGLGELRHLEGLQMEGTQLPSPLDVLYAANPLNLVQVRVWIRVWDSWKLCIC